jgi:hypothetical protein
MQARDTPTGKLTRSSRGPAAEKIALSTAFEIGPPSWFSLTIFFGGLKGAAVLWEIVRRPLVALFQP